MRGSEAAERPARPRAIIESIVIVFGFFLGNLNFLEDASDVLRLESKSLRLGMI